MCIIIGNFALYRTLKGVDHIQCSVVLVSSADTHVGCQDESVVYTLDAAGFTSPILWTNSLCNM